MDQLGVSVFRHHNAVKRRSASLKAPIIDIRSDFQMKHFFCFKRSLLCYLRL